MEVEQIIILAQDAKEFLKESLKKEGKDTVKMSITWGKNSEGGLAFKYEVQAVDRPDIQIDLGDGISLLIDGNSIPLLKNTNIKLKSSQGEDGKQIKGFVFDNPNVSETGSCRGCPSNTGGGCSTGGCKT